MQTAIDKPGNTLDLWVHRDVAAISTTSILPGLNSRIVWAELQLALSGRTPHVKGTVGHSVPWRRTPVQGNHFYLWWIPSGVRGSESLSQQTPGKAIFVRAVRHHDETIHPLPLGDLSEYRKVGAGELDPLYDDQRKVVGDAGRMPAVDVRVIAGHPGSGKTVALLYTARLLAERSDDDQRILYVTYTQNLAQQARRFFEACNIAHRVIVFTLAELTAELTGLASAQGAAEYHIKKVETFKEGVINACRVSLGPWSTHIPALWTEMRAFMLGMALPYEWKREGVEGGLIAAGKVLDRQSYRDIRKDYLGEDVADSAWEIGNRALSGQEFCRDCFTDQVVARQALDRLLASEDILRSNFGNLRGLVVDEIQDFTLLQVAFLAELTRLAVAYTSSFCFALAGDESQTVHPSGFDFGVTKDFLHDRLRTRPQPYELLGQRRCPERIAKVVDASWELYGHFLQKRSSYPKRSLSPTDDHREPGGTLLRWKLAALPEFSTALAELGGYTDLAIVDLNSRLTELTRNVSDEVQSIASRLTYVPTTIKGLDRKTVIVVGLSEVLREMEKATKRLSAKGIDLVALDNRNRIDEIRVALSRSTHTLLLLEEPGAVLDSASMGLGEIPTASWQEVQRCLREQYQDLDKVELISDRLATAEESLGRNDLDRARLITDDAEKLIGSMEDVELQEQVKQLRNRVDRLYADSQLKACERHLEMEDSGSAEKIIADLRPLLHHLDDPSIDARRVLLEDTLSLIKDLQLQRNRVLRGEYRLAYEAHKRIAARASGIVTAAPKRLDRALREDLQAHLEELAGQYWKDAEKARKSGKFGEAISAYRWMAQIRQDQHEDKKAAALECLATRYRELPPPVVDEPRLSQLVQTTATFVTMMHETEAERNLGAQAIASDWFVELCQALASEPSTYKSLARDIRLLTQSAAFSFAWHNRKVKQAAKEMLAQAVPSLRQQGLFMEALDMAQTFEQVADAQIWAELQAPDAVSNFLPVVETLYPAERQALVTMLARRTEELADTPPGMVDSTGAVTAPKVGTRRRA